MVAPVPGTGNHRLFNPNPLKWVKKTIPSSYYPKKTRLIGFGIC